MGLSLGLTGGVEAIFAVPLRVYRIGIDAREAVVVSRAVAGAMSVVGFLHRWKLGQVEIRTGLLFAFTGMVGAPIGTWIAGFLTESALLLSFAGLMVIIAWRLWQTVSQPKLPGPAGRIPEHLNGPRCR